MKVISNILDNSISHCINGRKKDLSVIIYNNYRWSELNLKAAPAFGEVVS